MTHIDRQDQDKALDHNVVIIKVVTHFLDGIYMLGLFEDASIEQAVLLTRACPVLSVSQ